MTIKAIKEPPARSVCSYPESVFRMSVPYSEGSDTVRDGISFTLAMVYDRDKATVQADLERGHV